MRVTALYFGVLKELMGREGETLEIVEGADVAALYDQLRARASKKEAWPAVAVAVNREYAGLATILRDGDEVALLPPVSGGSFGAPRTPFLRGRRVASFTRKVMGAAKARALLLDEMDELDEMSEKVRETGRC